MIRTLDLNSTIDKCLARFDACPFSALAGDCRTQSQARPARRDTALYTPDQRRRRDETPWTLVQGILAPLQFVVFLISLVLVLRFMITGVGFEAATVSIVVKTLILYTIMVTGAIWERVVFGQYLFAPAFFWEDVVSMLVIALHTAYLYVLIEGTVAAEGQMLLALAAYAAYVANASQFFLTLRAARREGSAGAPAYRTA